MARMYEFYRLIVLLGLGTLSVIAGINLLAGIGMGLLALAIVLHVSTLHGRVN